MKKISTSISFLALSATVLIGIFVVIQNTKLKTEISSLYEIVSGLSDENLVLSKSIDLDNDGFNETILIKQKKIEKQRWAECQDGCEGASLYLTLYSNTGITLKNYEFNPAVAGYPFEKNRLEISEGDITGDGKKEIVIGSQTGSEFSTASIVLGFVSGKIGVLKHFEYGIDTLYIKNGTLYGKNFYDSVLDKISSIRVYKWNGVEFEVTELE